MLKLIPLLIISYFYFRGVYLFPKNINAILTSAMIIVYWFMSKIMDGVLSDDPFSDRYAGKRKVPFVGKKSL